MFFESLEERARRDEICARAEDGIKLKPLFRYLHKEYAAAEQEYKLSGILSAGARLEKVELIERIVKEINKLYNLQYDITRSGD